MAEIKHNPSLRELQEYIAIHCEERGFKNTPVQECLLLTEEIGELAKAIRKDKQTSGMKIDSRSESSEIRHVAHEIADIIWVTTTIANLYGIDIEQAFRDKEVINHGRTWS